MPITQIESLLRDLSRHKTSAGLFNPYANARLAGNLRHYLTHLAAGPPPLALIGEAAGHRGCALTGIAFTSPETLRDSGNVFFTSHRSRLHRDGDIFEPSGRFVWRVMDSYGIVPLLWNALPFHPRKPGIARSNRTPGKAELALGRDYLVRILDIMRPRTIVAVGRKAQESLSHVMSGDCFFAVRHPSMGGSTLFTRQMRAILDGDAHA